MKYAKDQKPFNLTETHATDQHISLSQPHTTKS